MSEQGLIRVLVIDDSAFSRRTITRMLETSPLVRVVGDAGDGEEALRKVFELQPDLVTLDLEMPRMDGFTFLRLVMAKRPTAVMVISGRSGDGDVFKALELGAVDFIAKPTQRPSRELEGIQQEVIRKVHAIRQLRIDKVKQRVEATPPPGPPACGQIADRVIVVGSSTGGPAALMQIFGSFTEPLPCPIFVAQHMPRGFTRGFAERIDRLTCFSAKEAEDGDEPQRGRILVAPGGRHLEIESRQGRRVARVAGRVASDKYAPSVDRLFVSAAKQYGDSLTAVVLTGMGDDGRLGVLDVKYAGGTVFAESEDTAAIFGMPQQAIRTGVVDRILPLGAIASGLGVGVQRWPRSDDCEEGGSQ